MTPVGRVVWIACLSVLCAAASAAAAELAGTVRDETGGALPGVTVELRLSSGALQSTVTDGRGAYRFEGAAAGRYQISFTLINFATPRREVDVTSTSARQVDVVMHLALNADVTVTGKRTFANLADVENPAENLVGIAQSASQGAITAKQLDERPLMRDGEVLETVPGIIVTQHSGEGKANQYFLRGFNLDHGTDFATTVAGMPVNLPTHAHGQGYSDLNFLIPELVTGVQFSKGPYYADQGDFATAGSSNINYANVLDRTIAHVEAGGEGYARAVFAASPQVGAGHVVVALEAAHNDGPWVHPDNYRKVNGVLRYSQGDSVNGFSLTAMGYHGEWNSTDQVAQRAIASGLIDRFGAIDSTDGGHTYRYSGVADWQRGSSNGNASTRLTAAKRFRQEAEAAIALDTKNIDAMRGLISFYLQAPGLAGGDKKKAEAMVDEIARIDPASGHLARAQFLNETKAGGDLESLYRQAADAARTADVRSESIFALMNLYLSPKAPKYDAAEQQARALLKIDPRRAGPYSGLAIVYANAGRFADLDATLVDAEKAVPDSFSPYFQAARVLLTLNKELPRAERYLRKYMTMEPEAGAPGLAQAHWRLGLVLEKEARKLEAVAELEQAVKLKPDLEDARKDLKRLK